MAEPSQMRQRGGEDLGVGGGRHGFSHGYPVTRRPAPLPNPGRLVRFRSIAAIGVAILAALLLTSPAVAAAPVRLDGSFNIIGRIVSANDGKTGLVKRRVYDFTALCPGDRPCRRVALRRQAPGGYHFNSVLKRRANGNYKGVEKVRGLRCGGGAVGTQKTHLVFRPRQSVAGYATSITGRARFALHCPGFTIRQRARLTGKLR